MGLTDLARHSDAAELFGDDAPFRRCVAHDRTPHRRAAVSQDRSWTD